MSVFQGFVVQEGSITLYCLVKNSSNTPVVPDAAPTYAVYAPTGGKLSSGTMSAVSATTGLYSVVVPCLGASGYQSGNNYAVLFGAAISSTAWGDLSTFVVT